MQPIYKKQEPMYLGTDLGGFISAIEEQVKKYSNITFLINQSPAKSNGGVTVEISYMIREDEDFKAIDFLCFDHGDLEVSTAPGERIDFILRELSKRKTVKRISEKEYKISPLEQKIGSKEKLKRPESDKDITWRQAGGGCIFYPCAEASEVNESVWIPDTYSECEEIIENYYKKHPKEDTEEILDKLKSFSKRRLVTEVIKVLRRDYDRTLNQRSQK